MLMPNMYATLWCKQQHTTQEVFGKQIPDFKGLMTCVVCGYMEF